MKKLILLSTFLLLLFINFSSSSASHSYFSYYWTGSFTNTTTNGIINQQFIIPNNNYLVLEKINCTVDTKYIDNASPLYLSCFNTGTLLDSYNFNSYITPNIFLPGVLKNNLPDYSESGSGGIINFYIDYKKIVNVVGTVVYNCSVLYYLTEEYPNLIDTNANNITINTNENKAIFTEEQLLEIVSAEVGFVILIIIFMTLIYNLVIKGKSF